jgi:hypothetical protein
VLFVRKVLAAIFNGEVAALANLTMIEDRCNYFRGFERRIRGIWVLVLDTGKRILATAVTSEGS